MKTLKKIITVSVLIMSLYQTGSAQGIKISTYTEITQMSPKTGTAVGLVFPGYIGNIEVGGFYQTAAAILFNNESSTASRKSEKDFKGGYIAFSVMHKKKFEANLHVRVGTINNETFSIIPSLQGEYRVNKYLGIGGGLGVRSLRPSYILKVSLRMSR